MSGLNDAKYYELTELQEAAFPIILEGKDALIEAPEGKSKYASYIISALEIATQKEQRVGPSVLILTPRPVTEIDRLLNSIGRHSSVITGTLGLGESPESRSKTLQHDVDVIIANPKPLLNTMQELRCIFREIDLLVIDSADEMVASGLASTLKDIKKRTLCEPQTIIYSGKLDEEAQKLGDQYLKEPLILGSDGQNTPKIISAPPKVAESLSHGYIYVPSRMKISTLMAIVDEASNERCVIFTASKRGTDRLYRILRKNNYKATSLHGKLSDEKRAQRFANFTNGDIQFLLIADIPASDLDLQEVRQVINYDVPTDVDEYRYRADLVGVGKTTRLISLVSKQDRDDINLLEKELGQSPEELPLPESVRQELQKRKRQNKKKKPKPKRGARKKKSSRSGKKGQKKKELELPRPSFDKLSGGRSGGKKSTKSGVIGMIKKIFS